MQERTRTLLNPRSPEPEMVSLDGDHHFDF
jgi:hypothetical protein